jgi:hypothetical protein
MILHTAAAAAQHLCASHTAARAAVRRNLCRPLRVKARDDAEASTSATTGAPHLTQLKATTGVCVFSSPRAGYVERFLQPPLQRAGFGNVEFLEVWLCGAQQHSSTSLGPRNTPAAPNAQASLDRHTAALARGWRIVCLFVNDTCNAQVHRLPVPSLRKLDG